MQNLIPLIIIGLFVYFIFSSKGGVGCCGHGTLEPRKHQERPPAGSADNHQVNVIDLNPN